MASSRTRQQNARKPAVAKKPRRKAANVAKKSAPARTAKLTVPKKTPAAMKGQRDARQTTDTVTKPRSRPSKTTKVHLGKVYVVVAPGKVLEREYHVAEKASVRSIRRTLGISPEQTKRIRRLLKQLEDEGRIPRLK